MKYIMYVIWSIFILAVISKLFLLNNIRIRRYVQSKYSRLTRLILFCLTFFGVALIAVWIFPNPSDLGIRGEVLAFTFLSLIGGILGWALLVEP
jgi:hypothetical protein